MKLIKWFFIVSLIIIFSFASALYCFANTSDTESADDANNSSDDAQLVPADYNPEIKTTVTVYSHSTFEESTATDDAPAKGLIIEYTLYNPDEEKKLQPEMERIDEETLKAVRREEVALAKELIENGKWKEVDEFDKQYVNVPLDKHVEKMGGYSLLHPSEASDAQYPDIIFEFPKSPHTNGSYYTELNTKYPHIWGFHIFEDDKPGKYLYYVDWVTDYSSLDFSKVFFTEVHNTFDVKDEIEITGLTPEKRYSSLVKLIKLNENGSTEEIASTDKVQDLDQYWLDEDTLFEADEDGNAHISAMFENIELVEGKYILTVDCKSVDGDEPAFEHTDLKDLRETFIVEKEYDDFELFFGPDIVYESEYIGEITVPVENSNSDDSAGNSKPVNTGDNILTDVFAHALMAIVSASLLTGLVIFRRRASNE